MLNERVFRMLLLTLLHYVLCRNVLKNSPKKKKIKIQHLVKENSYYKKACVTLWPKLPFTLKKSILRQKKKKHGNSNISPCRNIIFQKSSKRNKNPLRYYYKNCIISNLKFRHKPKISSFKNPHVKVDLLLLPRGQNPLCYYTL
jgi:hypothetical protein